MDTEMVNVSDFARAANVKASFVTQLIHDRRIPEARRDLEDNRYLIPNRRCVIPSRYGKRKGKITRFYFRRDEVPEEWITDPSSRPEPGVKLEGDESEPLALRIERTFGVRVGRSHDEGIPEKNGGFAERLDLRRAGSPLFPEMFLNSPVRVVVPTSEEVYGKLREVNDRGVVVEPDASTGLPEGGRHPLVEDGGVLLSFIPWSATLLIEGNVARG
jgi:hypothetical protein